MNIYLIRHTKTYNPNELCFGQSEMPLEENFTIDFDWIKEHLNLENATYFSSPLRRCTKLLSYLSDENFIIDERLNEINFGDWEMKSWQEISPKDLDNWKEDFVNYRMKNGENFNDVFERSILFFDHILKMELEDVVVVCHSGIIRSIVSYILDFPLEKVFNLNVDYSSISKIEFDPIFNTSKLAYLNISPNSYS
ncbi:hypothetical protein A5893_15320 [Pedobacter psychrophilus]|uniref:Alpha-ribazole phosphatase n=1 Tax=Pedobacter psychrophilus TaxID=1826909 RepID=A0A179DAV4_9SPHI|nr:alpha-ribazole phosphatase family protein [Pedobacter psychrophilus]OAQ38167.1 hypothetical protein A5893_15320 [Pedobacter psychrophilus]